MVDSVATSNVPRWSKLSLRRATQDRAPAVLVHLGREAARALSVKMSGANKRAHAEMQVLKFSRFEPNLMNGFGYDGALGPAKQTGDWVILPVELKKETCTIAVVASLALIFDTFDAFPEARISVGRGKQIFSIITGVNATGGAFFGGEASAEFAMWVTRNPPPPFDPVLYAMRTAARSMTGIVGEGEHFRVYVPGGGYQLLIQDAGTGLWLDAQRTQQGGYRLNAHNNGSAREALIFLAGLAAFDQMADSFINR